MGDGLLDLVRGGRTLLRELADFLCYDGKAASRLTCARCLDGGVECEEVRLTCDFANRCDDVLDGIGARDELLGDLCDLGHGVADGIVLLNKLVDVLHALVRVVHRVARRLVCMGAARAHLLGARTDLLDGSCDLADAAVVVYRIGGHVRDRVRDALGDLHL